jgi:hypothetical protein
VTTQYLGFWSYTRHDDQIKKALTTLCNRLEHELQSQSDHKWQLFHDHRDITVGQDFNERLRDGLTRSIFLLPIITPRFFASEPCQAEVEHFIEREENYGTKDLIAPIYWITTDFLENPERRPADRIATAIHEHQWEDWRTMKDSDLSTSEVDRMISELAAKLLQRWTEYDQRRLAGTPMGGAIGWPTQHQRVGQHVSTHGSITGVPSDVPVWTVVNLGEKIHPQYQLTPDADGIWHSDAFIGGAAEASTPGVPFPIELVAVTQATSRTFQRYRDSFKVSDTWHGIPPQPGSRTLHRVTVLRDDLAQAAPLHGEYDEISMPNGRSTKRTIHLTPAGAHTFTTRATDAGGATLWTGTITLNALMPDEAHGTYDHCDRHDHGTHDCLINRPDGIIRVTGTNTSEPPPHTTFSTIWKRRRGRNDGAL